MAKVLVAGMVSANVMQAIKQLIVLKNWKSFKMVIKRLSPSMVLVGSILNSLN